MGAYHSSLCCFSGCSDRWNVINLDTDCQCRIIDKRSALHYQKIVQNEHFVSLSGAAKQYTLTDLYLGLSY